MKRLLGLPTTILTDLAASNFLLVIPNFEVNKRACSLMDITDSREHFKQYTTQFIRNRMVSNNIDQIGSN